MQEIIIYEIIQTEIGTIPPTPQKKKYIYIYILQKMYPKIVIVNSIILMILISKFK